MGDPRRVEYDERISRLGLILGPCRVLEELVQSESAYIREYALDNANEWLYLNITGTVEAWQDKLSNDVCRMRWLYLIRTYYAELRSRPWQGDSQSLRLAILKQGSRRSKVALPWARSPKTLLKQGDLHRKIC